MLRHGSAQALPESVHPSGLYCPGKRYSKCGFACSLKHLKSLHTFVLADS